MKYKKVTVLIPCHNEEKGISKVINDIPVAHLKRLGYITDIIVIDNNSTDDTSKIVREMNITLIHESRKGKGIAMKAGFRAISPDSNYVVMLDGDNTYKAREIPRLIEPLASRFCDVVVGSRLSGKLKKNSWTFRNRVVNWSFTFLVRQFYRANITDVLSGYYAWKHKVIVDLIPHLQTNGFAIEMEMLTKMVKLKHEVYSVPITYDEREGHSKIEAAKDGALILIVFFKNLFWRPRYKQSKRPSLSKILNLG